MSDVINLDHVDKYLGGRQVLKDVMLAVNQGDIFGFLGPNGAGKTTSIRIMLGLFAPDSGTALVLGQDAQIDKVREKVGFVLETDGLYENMSAYDNLMYYGQIYEVPQLEAQIEKSIGIVGLADRVKDKAGTYSKGMRQRLALARAILHNPEVLILDEPTAGVDPTGQIEIREIMLNMVRKQGKTILLSSHNLDEVQRICNRVALINKGQIRLYGELEKLQHQMSHGEVVIETAQPLSSEVLADLRNLAGVNIQSQLDKKLTLIVSQTTDVASIVSLLASRGVGIEQVKKQEASLEEIYTTIVKEAEQR
ncbi:MAG TPA: ABC transporter ATP-binding protein [Dehalococcoidales bacterium]